MKKIGLSLFIVTIASVACTSNNGGNAEERRQEYAQFVDEPTEVSFDQAEYNFGSVTEGEMVKHTFKFTNTGEKELILYDVKATCGCTVPEDWPKHPIAPGESGEIKVIFNSNDRVGQVNKTVRVEANTNPTVSSLKILGEVVEG